MKEKITAIVLAAGQGKRMHSKVQKQFLEIQDHPVRMKSWIATLLQKCQMSLPVVKNAMILSIRVFLPVQIQIMCLYMTEPVRLLQKRFLNEALQV